MNIEYLLVLLIAILIILLLFVVKKIHGFWLNPSCILISFWILYTALPAVVVFNGPIRPEGVMYIFIFLLVFSSSSLLFNWRYAYCKNSEKLNFSIASILPWGVVKLVFNIVFVIAIISNLYFVLNQGFSILFIFDNIRSIGGEVSSLRYNDGLKTNLMTQVSNLSVYFLVYLGGLLYGKEIIKKYKYIFLAFLPVIMILVFQSSKGILFFSIFLFYGASLIGKIYLNELNFLTIKLLRKAVILFLVLFPFVAISILSRGMSDLSVTESVNILYRNLASYSSGHLFSFTEWFRDRYFYSSEIDFNQQYAQLGQYTYNFVFKIIEVDNDMPIGTYSEYYNYNNIIITNVYTVFRGLIMDFSLVGSLIVAWWAGFIANLFFYRILTKKNATNAIIIFPFYIAVSYQTAFLSTFYWVSVPFTIICLCITFYFFKKLLTIKYLIIKRGLNDV